MYPHSASSLSNSTQQEQYSNSNYGWSGQSAYSSASLADPASENYTQPSDYEYQRSGLYSNHPNSMSASYSQGYYGRASVEQNQQPARGSAEGLNNLAYASGLESSNSRSSTTRNTQSYEAPSSQQQGRVRSPIETQSRYSVNPPGTSSSYPMRHQVSSSSTSSNQLAMDAAAALAGAVGRRNANNVQLSSSDTARDSPNVTNPRLVAASAPRRTASPQNSSASHIAQSYAPNHQQEQAFSSQKESHNLHNTPRRSPAVVQSHHQHRATAGSNQGQGLQQSYDTTLPPRSDRQTGNIASLVTAAHGSETDRQPQSAEVQESAPTFIDPTSIFDPYAQERERRRQAAERAAVEAKKKAEEEAKRKAEEEAKALEVRQKEERAREMAEAARQKKQREEAESQKRQTAARPTPSATGSKGMSKSTVGVITPTAQTEEERMAAELKAMMERMKAFQSKDPSLFKKLWDDMRKPVSSTGAAAAGTPSPQPAQRSLPAAESRPQELAQPTPQPDKTMAERSTSKPRVEKPQFGPDGQQLHLNGYPVVVLDNSEGLPDLGKFPAGRRIRQSYGKKRLSRAADEAREANDPWSIVPLPTASQAVHSPVPASGPTSSTTGRATPAALSHMFPSSPDQPVGQDKSETRSSSGTIWPLEKRNALTSTALRALKTIPENADVLLTEEDLYKILETNPSYIDLCQQLEKKGLKFHRGHFARELLNSVPDLKSGTSSAQPTKNSEPVSEQSLKEAAVTHATSQTPSLVTAAAATTTAAPPSRPLPLPGSGPAAQPRHMYQNPSPVAHGHPPAPYAYPPQPRGTPVGHFVSRPPPPYRHAIPHPPPPTAPSMAYTRMPLPKGLPSQPGPAPGSKEAAARKRDFAELIDLTELGDDDNYVVPDKHPRLEGPDSGDELGTEAFQAYQRRNQKMALQSNALNGYYPSAHQSAPTHAQHGQPAKQESFLEMKGQRHLLAKTLKKDEALKKQYYDPKTVARDILIATGRHPSERPLNVHLAGMLGKYIDLDSDVSTFEWDEVDPGGPPAPKVEIVDVPASKPRFKLGERVQRKARKPGALGLIDKIRRPDKEKRVNGTPSAINKVKQSAPDTSSVTQKSSSLKDQLQNAAFKKPASRLRHSLLASEEQATPAQIDPTRPPRIQSDRVDNPSAARDNVASVMSQEPPLRRKAGRPPGSKNKFPTVAAMKAQAGNIQVNVPLRDATPSTKEKFKCKWKKCSVVLHNLDTLRRHIGRVHRPSSSDAVDEGYTCWWKKCKFLKQDESTGEWVTTKVFDHWEDWLKHIEKDHVSPIALKWGDGPATSHVGKQAPSRSQ